MSFFDSALSHIPFAKEMFKMDKVQEINNRFDLFSSSGISDRKKIESLSIKNQYDNYADGGKFDNMFYHQMLSRLYDDDKTKRIKLYRTMASYPEVSQAIKEIANEFFVTDDRGEIIKGKLKNDYNEEIKTIIEKEFQKFIGIYKFSEKGASYVTDYVTEGELFWENVVSVKNSDKGIIGIVRIMPERIDPLYYDTESEQIDSFVLKKKALDEYPLQTGKFSNNAHSNNSNVNQMLFLNEKQVTYISNDKWEPNGKKYKVPPIAVAHGPYTQLSLVEDATVIYMLVRAPERLFFQIATGNMPSHKADAFVKRLMASFLSKKTVSDGKVQNTYDPISMTENLWLAKSKDMEASQVSNIGGGAQTMGNMEILNYFVQKLYKSLSVPLSRLNSDTAFSDGEAITREELKFAQEIMRMQTRWASALKDAFITHLKLKGRKLFDVAQKLKIKEISVKDDRGNDRKVDMASLYTDNFQYITWNCADVLLSEITNRLEVLKVNNENQIALLESKKQEYQKNLSLLNEKLLLENDASSLEIYNVKRSVLMDDISAIDQVIEDYREEYQNIADDNLSWWDQYKLEEQDLEVKFNEPSNFFALRQQQKFNMKVENFNQLASDDSFSKLYLQKWLLGMTDDEIIQNYSMAKISAAQKWELDQISQNGPDWRSQIRQEKAADQLGDMGMTGGLGAPDLPGGDDLPSFGSPLDDAQDGGEEAGEGADVTMKSPLEDSSEE